MTEDDDPPPGGEAPMLRLWLRMSLLVLAASLFVVVMLTFAGLQIPICR